MRFHSKIEFYFTVYFFPTHEPLINPMNYRFPLHDVSIKLITKKKEIKHPLYEYQTFRVSPNEIQVELEGMGSLLIKNGNQIEVFIDHNLPKFHMELSLQHMGLVGILHQRKLLNFHASAVAWNGMGIMICGDSGVGKSSLTAAFCEHEARFVSDDVTVIQFKEEKPYIQPLEKYMALRMGTIEQINPTSTASGMHPITGKYLFEYPSQSELVPLSHVLWITPNDGNEFEFTSLGGVEKFSMLRGEICEWEILKGMPETEVEFMRQLLLISQMIPITQVKRNKASGIKEFFNAVLEYMELESLR
ncbi:hypothetical protein EF405_20220 [Cyclobacteriaceae bacterium YHN15]|nr:hypothetical protein EF405_20220 [Cyclobacteriaceae bacterium YHN15]